MSSDFSPPSPPNPPLPSPPSPSPSPSSFSSVSVPFPFVSVPASSGSSTPLLSPFPVPQSAPITLRIELVASPPSQTTHHPFEKTCQNCHQNTSQYFCQRCQREEWCQNCLRSQSSSSSTSPKLGFISLVRPPDQRTGNVIPQEQPSRRKKTRNRERENEKRRRKEEEREEQQEREIEIRNKRDKRKTARSPSKRNPKRQNPDGEKREKEKREISRRKDMDQRGRRKQENINKKKKEITEKKKKEKAKRKRSPTRNIRQPKNSEQEIEEEIEEERREEIEEEIEEEEEEEEEEETELHSEDFEIQESEFKLFEKVGGLSARFIETLRIIFENHRNPDNIDIIRVTEFCNNVGQIFSVELNYLLKRQRHENSSQRSLESNSDIEEDEDITNPANEDQRDLQQPQSERFIGDEFIVEINDGDDDGDDDDDEKRDDLQGRVRREGRDVGGDDAAEDYLDDIRVSDDSKSVNQDLLGVRKTRPFGSAVNPRSKGGSHLTKRKAVQLPIYESAGLVIEKRWKNPRMLEDWNGRMLRESSKKEGKKSNREEIHLQIDDVTGFAVIDPNWVRRRRDRTPFQGYNQEWVEYWDVDELQNLVVDEETGLAQVDKDWKRRTRRRTPLMAPIGIDDEESEIWSEEREGEEQEGEEEEGEGEPQHGGEEGERRKEERKAERILERKREREKREAYEKDKYVCSGLIVWRILQATAILVQPFPQKLTIAKWLRLEAARELMLMRVPSTLLHQYVSGAMGPSFPEGDTGNFLASFSGIVWLSFVQSPTNRLTLVESGEFWTILQQIGLLSERALMAARLSEQIPPPSGFLSLSQPSFSQPHIHPHLLKSETSLGNEDGMGIGNEWRRESQFIEEGGEESFENELFKWKQNDLMTKYADLLYTLLLVLKKTFETEIEDLDEQFSSSSSSSSPSTKKSLDLCRVLRKMIKEGQKETGTEYFREVVLREIPNIFSLLPKVPFSSIRPLSLSLFASLVPVFKEPFRKGQTLIHILKYCYFFDTSYLNGVADLLLKLPLTFLSEKEKKKESQRRGALFRKGGKITGSETLVLDALKKDSVRMAVVILGILCNRLIYRSPLNHFSELMGLISALGPEVSTAFTQFLEKNWADELEKVLVSLKTITGQARSLCVAQRFYVVLGVFKVSLFPSESKYHLLLGIATQNKANQRKF